MAEDRKFKFENGRFVNRVSGEEIPDDEPVIIFRARDWHALAVLEYYHSMVEDQHHQQVVRERIEEFLAFKQAFPYRMKAPGVTRDFELHSSRRPVHIIIPENKESGDEMSHGHDQGYGHPITSEQRLEAVEQRMTADEERTKKIMADIDTLNLVLGGIADDAAAISADFKNLEAELQAAQNAATNNQPIDLTNSILMARNAQAALDEIVAAAAPAPVSGGTTQPPADTTQPPADTTQPPVDTTQPPADTTQPPVDTTQPPVDPAPVDPPADGSGSGDPTP